MLVCVNTSVWAAEWWGGSFSKLSGRIIRSLTVAQFNPSLVVAGNKGAQPGSAHLFVSRDGGVVWRFLNQNQPLHPQATDVQALSVLTADILLAGTWQYGLYRSTDGGNSFAAVESIPSQDIRGFAIADAQRGIVYAASGDAGVWRSVDAGQSWSASGLQGRFIWSVDAFEQGRQLLAASPTDGLFGSTDGGKTWSRLLEGMAVYEAVVVPASPDTLIAATDKGLYLSRNGGADWTRPAALADVSLSSVHWLSTQAAGLLVGGWNGGLWRYQPGTDRATNLAAALPVVQIDGNAEATLVGSWGQGLHIYPQRQTRLLLNAVKAADANTLQQLLDAGADANVTDARRNSGLIYASRDGQLEIARQLLLSGADVNWIDNEGVTALILAAHRNHPALVTLLLSYGANVETVDDFGRTAFDYASRRGAEDAIAQLLRKHSQ